jgi:hypothetical protein
MIRWKLGLAMAVVWVAVFTYCFVAFWPVRYVLLGAVLGAAFVGLSWVVVWTIGGSKL